MKALLALLLLPVALHAQSSIPSFTWVNNAPSGQCPSITPPIEILYSTGQQFACLSGGSWTAITGGSGGGTGTVTNVSVANANGISGTVQNPNTTPQITLILGAINPTSTGQGTPGPGSFTSLSSSLVTGITQCAQFNASGVLGGTGQACGTGSVVSVFGRTGAVVPASGDYSYSQVTGAAPLFSPAFTGTPTAPTAANGTNTTQIASTQFVQSAVAGVGTGFPITIGSTSIASGSTNLSLAGLTSVSSKIVNGVGITCGYSGSTVDARVNAALSDAENLTNGNTSGWVDASCEGAAGRQTTVSQINVGTSSGVGVGLILPCQGIWQGGMTDGSSAVMKVYGGATVRSVCPSSGTAGQFGLTATSGSNLGYIFTTATATNPYIYLQGFDVVNVAGGHATANGIGFYLVGPMNDGSTLDSVNVYDSLDTYAVKAYNVSAAATWNHSAINANYGGTPFWASTDASGYVTSLTLSNMTIGHAGTGLPEVLCTDTRSVTPKISSLHIDHSYTETGTDGVTADIQIQGCNKVSVTQHTFKSQSTGRTATAITTTNSYNTDIEVDGLTFGQGSGTYTYPANVVSNGYTGETKTSDSLGHFGKYSPVSVPSTLGSTTVASLVDTQISAGTSPICPNGTSGAFTTSGCSSSGPTATAAGQQPNSTGAGTTYTALTGWVNVKAYGATGNGSTVDGPSIISAMTANPTGTILIPPGTYLLDNSAGKVGLATPSTFTGRMVMAPGASFSCNTASTSSGVCVQPGAGFLWDGGTVTYTGIGSLPLARANATQYAINPPANITGNLTLNNVTVIGSTGPCVWIGPASNVTVNNLSVSTCTADGLHFETVQNVTVNGFTASNTGDDALAFTSASTNTLVCGGNATNINITNSKSRGLVVVGGCDINFSNFYINGTGVSALFASSVPCCGITYNSTSHVKYNDGFVFGSGTVTGGVSGNHFCEEVVGPATYIDFVNVHCSGSGDTGFVTGTGTGISNITWRGGSISSPVTDNGMNIQNCTHCYISDGYIENTPGYGIFNQNNSDITFSNMNIRDCYTGTTGALDRAFFTQSSAGAVLANGINVVDDQGTATCTTVGAYNTSTNTSLVQVSGISQKIASGTFVVSPSGNDVNESYQLAYSISSGSLGGSSLAAGACSSTTVSVPGASTSQSVTVAPATYPGDGFYWKGYVSASGTVTVKVCAAAAGTPTASTYAVRVQ